MFTTVLIANRGEIALRIARTCRELGIRTIAVHSAVDREPAVARLADEVVQIGPAPARRSYLNASALLEVAAHFEADAVHPGYGFLSEDADFAEACEAQGVTFIGAPPEVMARLADKAQARAVFAAAGLPVLPGGPCPDDESAAREAADEVGYPLIVKAVAGGGGRGMSIVRERREFGPAFRQTRATAQAVFGDGRVYLERYLDNARHIEVQVLADRHGEVVHLGERDCSVQRRHQKLLEETPAPGLSRRLADRIAGAAVAGARAVGYVGAGTFEFLVDENGGFFFMEINCRLQVEHPVTEAVFGIDLVREQIRAAAGLPLGFDQAAAVSRGVSIECRINAEDPARGFVPTPGLIREFTMPGGPFTRVDSHVLPGLRIPPDYDPLLAKVAVWAPDRAQAIARMERALAECRVVGDGVHTTVGFLADVLGHPAFRDGKHTTSLVELMGDGT
jgi:acetyl-CoA carboxylase biotin carboxylase subunit